MSTIKNKIVYITSSDYKRAENQIFTQKCRLLDGTLVQDVFEYELIRLQIKETLEVHIEEMVQAEVQEAYSSIKVPCIVEHAGLIFNDYYDKSYPGGLTKPMWDTLGDEFIKETNSIGRHVTARAVVAYCDGKNVMTFMGERTGSIANKPEGTRTFYWDTIFMPDDPSGKASGLTYAQIVDDPHLGLEYKVVELSQSTIAMLSFLEFRRNNPPDLWR